MRRRKRGIPIWIDSKGLVGYWSLDLNDVNGTTIYDLSSNENHGTSANTPTFAVDQNSVPSKAMVLNGSSDFINYGNLNLLNTADFTLSLWFYPKDVTTNHILGKFEDAGNRWYLRIDANSFIHFFSEVGTVIKDKFTGQTAIVANTWNNVAISCDRDGSWIVYINGSFESLTAPVTTTADLSNTGDLKIGGYATLFFDGNLSDISIYSEAKSADWILNQYNLG